MIYIPFNIFNTDNAQSVQRLVNPFIVPEVVPENQNSKKKKNKKKNSANNPILPPNGKESYPGLEIQPIKLIDPNKEKDLSNRMSVLTISPYADNKVEKSETGKKKKKKKKTSPSSNASNEEWKLLGNYSYYCLYILCKSSSTAVTMCRFSKVIIYF